MWLYQALEAEEQALQAGTQAALPPYPDPLGQLARAAWASWRELLTRLTRSELKHAINARASSRTAWKVLKDPRCVRRTPPAPPPVAWHAAARRAPAPLAARAPLPLCRSLARSQPPARRPALRRARAARA